MNWIELARLFCYHLATLMTLPDNGQDHVVDVAESESGPKADSSCHCSTCSLSFMGMQMLSCLSIDAWHRELCTKYQMPHGTRGPFFYNFLRCADLQNFSFSPEAAKALACMGLHGACHALQIAHCLEDDYGLAQAALDLWQTLDKWVMKRRRQTTWKTCVPTRTLDIL